MFANIRKSYFEHIECASFVYNLAKEIIKCDSCPEQLYRLRLAKVPREMFRLRRNLFSTLFQSVYQVVGISKERRYLYGKINFLNRIWVTCADNLLDDEDNFTFPIHHDKYNSHVMDNVISIMTADRILTSILLQGIEENVITKEHANILSKGSLQALLPSAAQEASEEIGIDDRPKPDVVLNSIHKYKTGILFHIPFVAPRLIENGDWDSQKADRIADALLNFGLACQLLDDVRDIARDFIERRNNYLLSYLYHNKPEILEQWRNKDISINDRLYRDIPNQTQFVCEMAKEFFVSSTNSLKAEGVISMPDRMRNIFIMIMFKILDLKELSDA